MCGEKKVMRGAKDKRMGSPPHVRGKVHHGMSVHRLKGITPACAGKSVQLSGHQCQSWDHPRMCGEKRYAASAMSGLYRDHPRMCGEK